MAAILRHCRSDTWRTSLMSLTFKDREGRADLDRLHINSSSTSPSLSLSVQYSSIFKTLNCCKRLFATLNCESPISDTSVIFLTRHHRAARSTPGRHLTGVHGLFLAVPAQDSAIRLQWSRLIIYSIQLFDLKQARDNNISCYCLVSCIFYFIVSSQRNRANCG